MNTKSRSVSFCCFSPILFFSAIAALSPVLAEEQDQGETAQVLTKEIRQIPGPKRTIAVQRISASAGFKAYYGDWDVGAGLEAMLTTALIETDRFVVLERANLSDILTEQELVAADMTGTGKNVGVGQLNSAQLLIFGAVTEFDTREKSGGFNIGTSIGKKSLGLGRSKAEGAIGMDIRVVDATTGRVLKAKHIEESVTAKGFDISGGYDGMSIGDSNFVKTPLGQAAREVITEAVEMIAQQAAKTEWVGQVVEFDGQDIFINAGSNSGIQEGDQFVIKKVLKRLTDPTTGEVLMLKTERLGMVRVGMVNEKIAFGEYVAVSHVSPARGDLAILPLD